MKQEDPDFIFPRRKPKTLGDIHGWHKHLLNECMRLEFRQKILKAAIAELNSQINHYCDIARDENRSRPAKLALAALNRIKSDFEEELRQVKDLVRIVHDTNEMIIGGLIKSGLSPDAPAHFVEKGPQPGANLLHGDGWIEELRSADLLEAEGKVPFVTFGTIFDSAGFDVIAFPDPDTPVHINIEYPEGESGSQ
ncbi:MAG TPA: hypothetical protein VM219_00660 [Phycisphaerae bacterium]|nr:hypothetical protein [Phycisphaerae bacterium]